MPKVRDNEETIGDCRLIQGDCTVELPKLPSQSVDCVITDPPYPEIDRDYGRWTEKKWWAMMDVVVPECMRILKPTGSAVFILQPNSERVGKMRMWLWEFVLWVGKNWGLIQDVYWWNMTTPPTVHCHETNGLTRPSVKYCVWAGNEECYRNQNNILWQVSDSLKASRTSDRALRYYPSGLSMRSGRLIARSLQRGGSTPFNLIPMAGCDGKDISEHGARTPLRLCSWWTRYICPPGGTILDPFAGSSTTAIAAIKYGCKWIGIERVPQYIDISRRRIRRALALDVISDDILEDLDA